MATLAFIALVVAVVVLLPLWLRAGESGRRLGIALFIVALAVVTSVLILDVAPAGIGARATFEPGPSESQPDSTASETPMAGSTAPAAPDADLIFLRHEVIVEAGQYRIFMVEPGGQLSNQRSAEFATRSVAPVDRIEADDGLIHWRTVVGGYAGWSYVPGRSGPFAIREVLRSPDGSTTYREVDPGT